MGSNVSRGAVVVGYDGSDGAQAAVAWAADYAESHHRRLVLVHGAGDPRRVAGDVTRDESRQALATQARRTTEPAVALVQRLAPTVSVTVVSPMQDPRDALLELSEGAAVVVVGTRGRGRVLSLVLGSVSAAVSTHAACPVAVVRPALGPDDDEHARPVVVGVDATDTSTGALAFAFDLASTEGQPLDVVHNWVHHDQPLATSTYDDLLVEADEHQRALRIALAGYADTFPDVPVRSHMPRSDPVQTLTILSETAGTVVVGARHHPGTLGILSSVSRAVLERAHCTVVVVRS